MNKKIISICIVGIFVLTAITSFSTVGKETIKSTEISKFETDGENNNGRIYGNVQQRWTNSPLGEATVELWRPPANPYKIGETTTDSDGYYEFSDLKVGKDFLHNECYFLLAKKEGYTPSGYKDVALYGSYSNARVDFKLGKEIKSKNLPTIIGYFKFYNFQLIYKVLEKLSISQ